MTYHIARPLIVCADTRENLNLKLAAGSCGYWTASCQEEAVLYNVKVKTFFFYFIFISLPKDEHVKNQLEFIFTTISQQ